MSLTLLPFHAIGMSSSLHIFNIFKVFNIFKLSSSRLSILLVFKSSCLQSSSLQVFNLQSSIFKSSMLSFKSLSPFFKSFELQSSRFIELNLENLQASCRIVFNLKLKIDIKYYVCSSSKPRSQLQHPICNILPLFDEDKHKER